MLSSFKEKVHQEGEKCVVGPIHIATRLWLSNSVEYAWEGIFWRTNFVASLFQVQMLACCYSGNAIISWVRKYLVVLYRLVGKGRKARKPLAHTQDDVYIVPFQGILKASGSICPGFECTGSIMNDTLIGKGQVT